MFTAYENPYDLGSFELGYPQRLATPVANAGAFVGRADKLNAGSFQGLLDFRQCGRPPLGYSVGLLYTKERSQADARALGEHLG